MLTHHLNKFSCDPWLGLAPFFPDYFNGWFVLYSFRLRLVYNICYVLNSYADTATSQYSGLTLTLRDIMFEGWKLPS
jgi:hypothetical protein